MAFSRADVRALLWKPALTNVMCCTSCLTGDAAADVEIQEHLDNVDHDVVRITVHQGQLNYYGHRKLKYMLRYSSCM
jgi:hypothetical protein